MSESPAAPAIPGGPASEHPTRVVLASRNRHKIEELRRILDESDLAVELLGVDDFEGVPEVAETGATFAANALLKAVAVCTATGVAAVADDSGLCVDALNGMPGIFSARWSGGGGDTANLELVLAQLADVPPPRRGAHFRCAAAVALPDGRTAVVEGQMDGHLIDTPRGTNGFGYDPIFVPADISGSAAGDAGGGRTSAELTDSAKDAISHRGKALRALVPVLRDLLPPTR